jgi:hypothetical protein
VLFFCKVHLDSVGRDIEGELAKSPKMVSNVQQLMFIGENLFALFNYYFCTLLLQANVVDPHHIDADPDSTYHPDADPDSYFHLMLIRIQTLASK